MTDKRPQTQSELTEFVRSIDVRAPEELHRRTAAMVADRSRPRPVRRPALALAGAATLAAIVALTVALASGGGGERPRLTLASASAVTLRSATMAAPAEDPHARAQLAESVDGIAFPYWEEHFGWRSTGSRHDRIRGRPVQTVFYADRSGRRIGYAIVGGGGPAPQLSGGTVSWRHGTPYRLLSLHGSRVVTWLRGGHLCIVSGRHISDATLLRLASWDEDASPA